ncbi:DnaA N-terminal domain-containing protein [Bradyrhizobium sp.]|uniref:DnaA N-terminal domain-containing protein n=1 Tax=Bradyrhizobium sp. TaxID=376 RepID=UPI0039E6EC13
MTREEALKDFNRKRLAAMDRVRRDTLLSASFRAVGGELFAKVDFDTGDAYPSIEHLEEKLGLSPRTVKMAVKALQERGYFTVVKRGRCNRYVPIYEPVAKVQILHLSEDQQGQNLHLLEADRCKNRPEQVQKASPDRCKKGPPTSLRTPLDTSGRAAAGAVGAAPDGAAGPSFDLGIPGVALRRRLGDAVFRSWLGKVAVVSIGTDELVLQAPSRFVASYIQNNFAEAVLAAWRVGSPSLVQLRVVVEHQAGAEAAATGEETPRRADENPDARWLIEIGIGLVADQLGVKQDRAAEEITDWMGRCRNDPGALRQIIVSAARFDLRGDRFRSKVKQDARSFHQGELKFGPEDRLKKRSAS